MSSIQEKPSRSNLVGRIARVVGALVVAFLMSSTIADRRGWVLGSLAFLMYGSLAGAGALSFSGLRRWSADHVVLDALLLVPLSFFALLMIPALPWWAAASIALAIGVLVVPLMVRRRTAQLAKRGLRA
jgi:uncharacterized membrane protein (DUF2068 family)